jgi:hypothetical protein
VKFDKRTTKPMSGDVGFSASEGLKELLNLEAFQKPTESHPLSRNNPNTLTLVLCSKSSDVAAVPSVLQTAII